MYSIKIKEVIEYIKYYNNELNCNSSGNTQENLEAVHNNVLNNIYSTIKHISTINDSILCCYDKKNCYCIHDIFLQSLKNIKSFHRSYFCEETFSTELKTIDDFIKIKKELPTIDKLFSDDKERLTPYLKEEKGSFYINTNDTELQKETKNIINKIKTNYGIK